LGGARCAGGRGALRGRAGAREEYATLGGSDGGLAPPRDLDFQAFQPRACDIAERSGISFEIDLERSFESGCADPKDQTVSENS